MKTLLQLYAVGKELEEDFFCAGECSEQSVINLLPILLPWCVSFVVGSGVVTQTYNLTGA